MKLATGRALGDIIQLTLNLKPDVARAEGRSTVTCFGIIVEINQSGVPMALTERGPRVVAKPESPDPIALSGRGILEIPLPVIVSPVCTRERIRATRCGIWHTSISLSKSTGGERILYSQFDGPSIPAAIAKAWTAWQAKLAWATARHPSLRAVQFVPKLDLRGRALTASVTHSRNRSRSLARWRDEAEPLIGKSLDELLEMGRAALRRQEDHGSETQGA